MVTVAFLFFPLWDKHASSVKMKERQYLLSTISPVDVGSWVEGFVFRNGVGV